MRCALTEPLKASDISADGKSATITVTLNDPWPGGDSYYFYPAYLGTHETQDIRTLKDYNNLHSPLQMVQAAEQDGTLENIAANLDFAFAECVRLTDKGELPVSIELENWISIFAFTFLNGSEDLTPRVKELVVADAYTVRRKEPLGDGPIYFAMIGGRPISKYDITTTDGKKYTKTVENGTCYEYGKFYKMALKMTPVAPASPGPDIEWTSVRYIPEPDKYNCFTVHGPWVDNHFTPSAISLSGTSTGYWFWMNYGSTVTLNGLTATYDGGNEFISAAPGDLNLVVKGTNSISCKNNDQSVVADGTLKLSGNGTLTVTALDSSRYGLHASSNYHVKFYDSVNQVWLESNNSDASVLAAEGYTVTRSDTQNNGDGTYTWTYTVASAQ